MVVKKVLAVDDQPFAIRLLTAMLVPQGYEVISAKHGIEAVEQYRNERPDVVLMDILMPHMDGFDATKAILDEDPNAKILMCTALDQMNVMEKALNIGAVGYIVKPFQKKNVLEKIEDVLKT